MPVTIFGQSQTARPCVIAPDGDPLYGPNSDLNVSPPDILSLPFCLIQHTTCATFQPINMASPGSLSNGPSPSGSRIGRPPQWTVSRSRKLARLYLFSTLSIEKIIKVLEEDGFSPKYGNGTKKKTANWELLTSSGKTQHRRPFTRCWTMIHVTFGPSLDSR
jgi:hypothetical protein